MYKNVQKMYKKCAKICYVVCTIVHIKIFKYTLILIILFHLRYQEIRLIHC